MSTRKPTHLIIPLLHIIIISKNNNNNKEIVRSYYGWRNVRLPRCLHGTLPNKLDTRYNRLERLSAWTLEVLGLVLPLLLSNFPNYKVFRPSKRHIRGYSTYSKTSDCGIKQSESDPIRGISIYYYLGFSQVKSRMIWSCILTHTSHFLASSSFKCPIRYTYHINQNLQHRVGEIFLSFIFINLEWA